MYKGYLIDLDGTMYRGEEQIEEASDFVKALGERVFHIYSLQITQLVNQNKLQKSLFVSIFQRKRSKYSQRVWLQRTLFMSVNKMRLYI